MEASDSTTTVPTSSPTEDFSAFCSRVGIDISGGCTIAGEDAQLLCLTDGSQQCRPFNSDGSVNLRDLTEEEVKNCGPCGDDEDLRCPTEHGSCGSDTSVLICHFEGGGTIGNTDACLPATESSTFYQVAGHAGDPLDFCGCCDGFDPSIDESGQCPESGKSAGSSENLPFNACCDPCREEVPEEFRPCCCQAPGRCSDPTMILTYGYSDCPAFTEPPTSFPTEAPSTEPTGLPTETPTILGTDAPSAEPTGLPTEAPTSLDTDAPSTHPTDSPTESPTSGPTDSPTMP